MNNKKLKNKLIQLCKTKQLEYWNGGFIKRVRVGSSSSKIFQVNKIKYKLELEGESRCDNTTNFIPTEPKPVLHDWREGRYYTGYNEISNFLKLPVEDVMEIWKPLLDDAKYNEDEIKQSFILYQDAMTNITEMFCL